MKVLGHEPRLQLCHEARHILTSVRHLFDARVLVGGVRTTLPEPEDSKILAQVVEGFE